MGGLGQAVFGQSSDKWYCVRRIDIHKVFVYGTLRPKDSTGNYIEASHRVGDYLMYNYYDKFPYILPDESDMNNVVYGNLLEVDDAELSRMDRYEGVASGLYNRVKETVVSVREGSSTEAWVYVGGSIAPPVVESGDWAHAS